MQQGLLSFYRNAFDDLFPILFVQLFLTFRLGFHQPFSVIRKIFPRWQLFYSIQLVLLQRFRKILSYLIQVLIFLKIPVPLLRMHLQEQHFRLCSIFGVFLACSAFLTISTYLVVACPSASQHKDFLP